MHYEYRKDRSFVRPRFFSFHKINTIYHSTLEYIFGKTGSKLLTSASVLTESIALINKVACHRKTTRAAAVHTSPSIRPVADQVVDC